jgi:hypothetical protein
MSCPDGVGPPVTPPWAAWCGGGGAGKILSNSGRMESHTLCRPRAGLQSAKSGCSFTPSRVSVYARLLKATVEGATVSHSRSALTRARTEETPPPPPAIDDDPKAADEVRAMLAPGLPISPSPPSGAPAAAAPLLEEEERAAKSSRKRSRRREKRTPAPSKAREEARGEQRSSSSRQRPSMTSSRTKERSCVVWGGLGWGG